MNFLAPLYALGALAILGPIVLHLVRKRPSEVLDFSSLMFLDAAPPKLTSRSHIEQWLLLACRTLLIGSIAFAFARPYLNSAIQHAASSRRGVHRLLLIDTSASMQRPGIRDSVGDVTRKWIDEASAGDTLAVYSFSNQLVSHLSVRDSLNVPIGGRSPTALAAVEKVAPDWGIGNVGQALASSLDALQIDYANGERNEEMEIALVTDLATGNSLDGMVGIEWPSHARLRVLAVKPTTLGNAYATLLPTEQDVESTNSDREPDGGLVRSNPVQQGAKGSWRVRVTNEAGGSHEVFTLQWLDAKGIPIEGSAVPCRVPLGTSTVVRLQEPPSGATAYELFGDATVFDNRRFFVPPAQRSMSVACVEADIADPENSLRFFAEHVPLDEETLHVDWLHWKPGSPGSKESLPSPIEAAKIPLVLVGHELTDEEVVALKLYLTSGGNVLDVWDRSAEETDASGKKWGLRYAERLQAWTGFDAATVTESKVDQYRLLASVDLKSPLFAPFADAKFNDFSKIRFWKHRQVSLRQEEPWTISARFDSGSPAIFSTTVGSGTLTILAAGWQPNESQLALSSKFVPMLSQWFALALPKTNEGVVWESGERFDDSRFEKMLIPGTSIARDLDLPQAGWKLSVPGIYSGTLSNGTSQSLAINVPLAESKTQVIDLEEFSR